MRYPVVALAGKRRADARRGRFDARSVGSAAARFAARFDARWTHERGARTMLPRTVRAWRTRKAERPARGARLANMKTKNEKRKTKNEKRKTKNEKRKTKNEKRKTKNEKRKTKMPGSHRAFSFRRRVARVVPRRGYQAGLPQLSRRPTIRLNTGWPGFESTRSATK
ncbi:hypothetical protein ISJ33_02680 [Burkholderia pseudomallei]|uniref:hypothetical protein n=1 Tax=Burkholderia pseudomallei TaxID=28450 RepID=UPI0013099225|nr:hypothetical protein [Burkholderia pseudomallei]MBF4065034.1 hypothetical protein [Burkholderia pseudomallei]MWA23922.1 hypothetical protein [Burkholderia pseudomallei]